MISRDDLQVGQFFRIVNGRQPNRIFLCIDSQSSRFSVEFPSHLYPETKCCISICGTFSVRVPHNAQIELVTMFEDKSNALESFLKTI